eukprot:TRINITY_DN5803_c0_g3_i2.p1 TRINITY_DN5803_c0_g3~~TRINITY_DN5803_c0_g3_i2.p1  ORF type:complete len:155 (+),score=23.58 TRINITY_DN5803_c0_g3_i2:67-531(+)
MSAKKPAPKKKPAKSKSNDEEKKAENLNRHFSFEEVEKKIAASQQVFLPVFNDWVKLEIKLLNWKFMNFDVLVRTNTPVRQIASMIEARHGRIRDLRLFTSPPSLKNEITDTSITLSDIGIKGGPRDAPEQSTLFYDFKSAISDPLLSFSLNAS